MRKGYVWVFSLLVWFLILVVCFGRSDASSECSDAEPSKGIQHLAGVNTDLLWQLPDKPAPVSLGEFKITAYCACEVCCGKPAGSRYYGITASGTKASEGRTIAADPSVLPYGTVVYIDGHGYTVEDTGGSIIGNRLDIYFENHEDALEWGVQYKEVFVYGE